MNKKSLVLISFAFIFLLSMSIVSAGDVQNEKVSFGEWLKGLWGKITGKTLVQQQNLEPFCYADGDGDGYIPGLGVRGCPPANDCDDNTLDDSQTACTGTINCNTAAFSVCAKCINPDAIERCDGKDNNCDGTIDEGCQVPIVCGNKIKQTGEQCDDGNIVSGDCCSSTCQNELAGTKLCGVGACKVGTAKCNNGVPVTCTPGTPVDEICTDTLDNDCNGVVNNGCSISTCTDADNDGYNSTIGNGCGTVADCNDADATIKPGATEICDGKDNDCDVPTSIDEGLPGSFVLNNLLTQNLSDSCTSIEFIKEYWCENGALKSAVKSCKDFAGANTFCDSGACVSCVDTDFPPALNFTVYGETYNLLTINNHKKDFCKNNTHLNESSCSGNNVVFQIKDCTDFGNAYSCKNGACYCKPKYTIDTCNTDDTALFVDASACGLPDYTADYDCNGDGLISGPSCAGMENENVGIDGLLFDPLKNYTKTTKPGISLVQLAEDNGGGVDFNWNFSSGAEPLNFCNINVEVADSSDDFGYTIIKNVSAKNKTVWVERLNKTSGAICLKDVPGIVSINEFSTGCNGIGEILVPCPGKNSTYNCKIEYDVAPSKSSWFQVWPLNHSAVKEMTGLVTGGIIGGCISDWSYGDWSNLTGLCGTRNVTDLNSCLSNKVENQTCVSQEGGECISDWDCTNYGKCIDGFKERICTDSESCGVETGKPSEISECKGKSSLFIILAIAGLILIIFLILYFMKRKSYEEEPSETQAPASPPSPPSPPANVYTPRPQYPTHQLAPRY